MERSEQTRTALLEAARAAFAGQGYQATRLDEVVAAAGVTKGALYHHYAGKRELFAAVYEQVEQELAARSAQAAAGAGDPLDMLRAGMTAFLDACLEPDVRRIVLVDGLSVLGWEEWVAQAQRHNLGMVERVLEAAIGQGLLRAGPVRPLAHLLQGALIQGGMALARAEDVAQARADTVRHLSALLDGLRV